ncbi:MAG: class I tRNA ligase family protein, partial [Eubacteriales bacterium]
FAKKFGIDIIPVIKGGDIDKEAYTGEGEMVNSGFLNGLTNKADSIAKMIQYLTEHGLGEGGVQYKMKDWAFNRQRYWGEPIPIVHCPTCGMVPVPYDQLPLRLPPVTEFEPGQGGESPLARVESFVNCTCPRCGGKARRETDTMPQWAGSSWYFLRYIDPHNSHAIADMDKMRYWLPVDWYNGGMEHVTRHMIYSRFWHRFLYDIGEVPTPEPYAKRTAQGLILGPDGEKMSKSRGNVVDPNDVVKEMGADVLRVYILFMGDYGAAAPWSENSMRGCKRFLERVADLPGKVSDTESPALESALHNLIKKVSTDIEEMKSNTAIAAMMGLLNDIDDAGSLTREQLMTFVRLLCPFAPHLCEEIWEQEGGQGFCSLAPWPEFDEAKTVDETVEIAVQINGKVRGKVTLPQNADKDTALTAVRADPKLAVQLEGKTVVKEIVVPNKIINIVVR